MNFARNTTNGLLLLAILFSFLTVVGSGSVAVGDLLDAPNRIAVPEGHTRVYRAVSEAEYQDILKRGRLRQGRNELGAIHAIMAMSWGTAGAIKVIGV